MYHPINKPECAPQLEKLMGLARATIAFGLENDETIAKAYTDNIPQQAALQKQLGPDFLHDHGGAQLLAAAKKRFLEHFEAEGNHRAGQWLWRKPATIAAPVVRLLVVPLSEKKGILEGFDADIDLKARFGDGQFLYSSIAGASQQALDLVKEILLGFYSGILAKRGVPSAVLQELHPFDRQAVLQAYLRANRQLKVCPGCDGSPPSLSDGIVHEDCDHFFPKSKYPFLAIHPLNLTPYCKVCNQDYKWTRDVLDTPGVASLADIYHPYLRPADKEVKPVIERDAGDGQLHLRLRASSSDAQSLARLSSLNWLLELESRWDDDLHLDRLSPHLDMALLHATQDERDTGHVPTPDWFKKKLEVIAEDMIRGRRQIVGYVPASALATWVAYDDTTRAEWFGDYVKGYLSSA